MFRTALIAATVGITALAVATAQADTLRSHATDFSSQNKNNKGGGGGGGSRPNNNARQPQVKVYKPQTTVRTGGEMKKFSGGSKQYGGEFKKYGGESKKFGGETKKFESKKFGGSNTNVNIKQNVITTNPNIKTNFSGSKIGQPISGAKVFKLTPGPGPANKVVFKPAQNVQFVKVGQFSAPAWKVGPKKIWWGNSWRVFVPITALGVVALAGAYYYPDAYLATPRYYCEGILPNGCRVNWQRVAFEDGDGDWQCVQYCPRPGMPPPPRTVALVAPPPPPQGGACEISIYSEPGFGGTNAQASDEQAHLADNGWQNQIASVRVKSGTWDFFSDQEFTGETMRLPPGEYADLGPEWTKKAGSFMCVQP